MKLILAIINKDDAPDVQANLTKDGFSVTKLATTGGFLLAGNTTLLVGTDDDKVPAVCEIIEKNSKKRKQMLPAATNYMGGAYSALPVEVTVGGATIFVLNVEEFKKV